MPRGGRLLGSGWGEPPPNFLRGFSRVGAPGGGGRSALLPPEHRREPEPVSSVRRSPTGLPLKGRPPFFKQSAVPCRVSLYFPPPLQTAGPPLPTAPGQPWASGTRVGGAEPTPHLPEVSPRAQRSCVSRRPGGPPVVRLRSVSPPSGGGTRALPGGGASRPASPRWDEHTRHGSPTGRPREGQTQGILVRFWGPAPNPPPSTVSALPLGAPVGRETRSDVPRQVDPYTKHSDSKHASGDDNPDATWFCEPAGHPRIF
jgi:hypothetical protein